MTSSSPPPVQRRVDAVRNRAVLLEAAQSVFGERGLDASIDEIVQRAGFAKGTFFRHFAGKEALIEALAIARLDRLAEVAREISEGQEPGWEALRLLLERSVETVAGDCSFGQSGNGQVETAEIKRARQALVANVEQVLGAAQATGEVRSDLTSTDLPMIMMAITHATAPLHDAHPELWRRYLRLFLDGTRSDSPSDLGAPPVSRDQFERSLTQVCDPG